MKETVVAGRAAAYLAQEGWACSFEVQAPGLSGRPDIVGLRGVLTLIAEAKTSMSLALLGQIVGHQGQAHYLVAVTPYCRPAVAARHLLAGLGAGWLMVGADECKWELSPRLGRGVRAAWTARLEPQHQTYCEPGSAAGGYWSPFKRTCERVRAYVERHPGASTREVVAGVEHHYCRVGTARSALFAWARDEKIPGVRVDLDHGPARWYADGSARG